MSAIGYHTKRAATARAYTKASLLGIASTTVLVALSCGAAAQAQDAGPSAEVEAVVVTGSRIRSPDATSVSPISTVTSKQIAQRGVVRVEDLINTLPQAFADQGSGNRGGTVGASGTATINLRNLGNQRTLVLIDGKRLMQGDPARSAAQAADINNIPAALIQQIDVVTGGASAVYGSDALAGVVNFMLKRDFEGVQLDVQGGLYMHNNGTARSSRPPSRRARRRRSAANSTAVSRATRSPPARTSPTVAATSPASSATRKSPASAPRIATSRRATSRLPRPVMPARCPARPIRSSSS
jgi:iron complex outermembrane receptor protein